jgi:hypothetical protein
MAESAPVAADAAHDAHHHGEMSFWSKYVFSTDHKVIAMQYMFTGMAMALIGGFMAYAFRMQLAFPGMEVPFFGVVSPADYNSLVTNHGSIMIFWVAMPVLIAAFGNYLRRHGVPAPEPALLSGLPAQRDRAARLTLRAGRRFRRRLDRLSAALGQERLQPHAAGIESVAAGGGAGVRGVSDGRYQLRDHGDEL